MEFVGFIELEAKADITPLGGSGQGRYGDRRDECYASNRAYKHKPKKLKQP